MVFNRACLFISHCQLHAEQNPAGVAALLWVPTAEIISGQQLRALVSVSVSALPNIYEVSGGGPNILLDVICLVFSSLLWCNFYTFVVLLAN